MEETQQLNTFWGAKVSAGPKPTPFVPPGDVLARLHLSTACLAPGATDGTKVYVMCKVNDQQPLVFAVLRAGGCEMMGLDLVYDEYTEFMVKGAGTVHLTGYYMPMETEEAGDAGQGFWQGNADDSDDDDEVYNTEATAALRKMLNLRASLKNRDDDDDDEDDNEDDEDEDEDVDDDEVPNAAPQQDLDSESDEDFPQSRSFDIGSAASARVQQTTVVVEEIDTDNTIPQVTEASKNIKKRKLDPAVQKREQPARSVAAREQTASAAQPTAQKAAPKMAAATSPAKTPAKSNTTASTPSSVKLSRLTNTATQQSEDAGDALVDGVETPGPWGRGIRKFPNGFVIENIAKGSTDGKVAKAGKRVKMRYCGKLKTGRIFDQTKGNKTFVFRLGVGEVIKGWDKGIEGMRVGDKRKLTVPPSMAYGDPGIPPTIPPKATLVFEVDLVNVM